MVCYFNIRQELILHTFSPAQQATAQTIRKSFNGSGNTFLTQRIHIDSIGTLILCKHMVEFNRRAATGIRYASPTFVSHHWVSVGTCTSRVCRFLKFTPKSHCPNWKVLAAFVIGKTFSSMIFDRRNKRKKDLLLSSYFPSYLLISLLILCNAWVKKLRKETTSSRQSNSLCSQDQLYF